MLFLFLLQRIFQGKGEGSVPRRFPAPTSPATDGGGLTRSETWYWYQWYDLYPHILRHWRVHVHCTLTPFWLSMIWSYFSDVQAILTGSHRPRSLPSSRPRISKMPLRWRGGMTGDTARNSDIFTQVDLSSAKQNNIVAGLLKSAMLPLQQVVDGRDIWLNNFLKEKPNVWCLCLQTRFDVVYQPKPFKYCCNLLTFILN